MQLHSFASEYSIALGSFFAKTILPALNTLSVTGFYKAVILHDILKRADEGLMKG
jgi:hypothetical protein